MVEADWNHHSLSGTEDLKLQFIDSRCVGRRYIQIVCDLLQILKELCGYFPKLNKLPEGLEGLLVGLIECYLSQSTSFPMACKDTHNVAIRKQVQSKQGITDIGSHCSSKLANVRNCVQI